MKYVSGHKKPSYSPIVVVPAHKDSLSKHEVISLRNCVEVLSRYRKVLIHPKKVDGSRLARAFGLDDSEAFPDECFASYANYN